MADEGSRGSVMAPELGEGRERGARRKKVYGYLKAANELRQSYQSQRVQPRNQEDEFEQGYPGPASDVDIVRSGDEEMILFPSYARKHSKRPQTATSHKPGTLQDIANPDSSGDAEYWRREWEHYEDNNAIVDIDVRGWIYTPHKGPITRKNRMLIAVARRLSGVPAPTSSPPRSRDSSRHSVHRERRDERAARYEEEEAVKRAQSIVKRGEGEADAAWRGRYSKDPSRGSDGDSLYSTRSVSPSDEPMPGRLPHTNTDTSLVPDSEDASKQPTAADFAPSQPVDASKEDFIRANAHLMARLKPFMHIPLAGAPITTFFFNDQKSQSRSINTDDSGHFVLRAALDFIPTSLRVLASENLSSTEKITITDPGGVSLISDIDDTIKHSAVASGAREIFNNTFIRELEELTIKGVKEWYSKLAAMGVQLHYVSNSPWQLYPLLRRYFALAGLPAGSFHLKQYSGMLQGIFEPAAERKKGPLEKIMKDFPQRRFILVGDSGEADLEVYTEVVAANPGRVLGVFIRDVTTTERKAFFDQSAGNSSGQSRISADVHPRRERHELSDAPENRPTPPPRRSSQAGKLSDPPGHLQGDLIDFSEDIPGNDTKEALSSEKLGKTEQHVRSSAHSAPPNPPSKPLSLRSSSNTQSHCTDDARPITAASGQSTSYHPPSPSNRPGPPPKPRRPSTAIDITNPRRAHMSSPRQHQSHRPHQEEGYTTSARRQIISAYNTLPSARMLWSGSSHSLDQSSSSPSSSAALHPSTNDNSNTEDRASVLPSSPQNGARITSFQHRNATPPSPPSSSSTKHYSSIRHNISSAAHRSWANSTDPTMPTVEDPSSSSSSSSSSNSSSSGGAPYSKKEEAWRRRWARAEELMRREGVPLRRWRVGEDVMVECVDICQKSLKTIEREQTAGKMEGV